MRVHRLLYELSVKYAQEADKTQKEMNAVTEAMKRISDMSKQIETIIGQIERSRRDEPACPERIH